LQVAIWPGAERLLRSNKEWVAAVRAPGPPVLNLDTRRDQRISKTAPYETGVWREPFGSIFVMQSHPAHGAGALVAALGDEIEPVERAHQ
jgi:hypothetical protein